MLGVCRGMQLINVAAGGTLYQDLAEEFPGAIKHDYFPFKRPDITRATTSRTTWRSPPAPGSPSCVGAGPLRVNSMHHQGVRELGEGLVATAEAPDGLIEAVEGADDGYLVAVQWHPEVAHRQRRAHARTVRRFHRRGGGVVSERSVSAVETFDDERGTVVERMGAPLRRMTRAATSGGLVLLACAAVALVWANSPWYASYHALWETRFTPGARAPADGPLPPSRHQRRPDGGVLLPRRPRDQARDPRRRAGLGAQGGASRGRRRWAAWSCRRCCTSPFNRGGRGRARAGASPWRRTSPSPSASSRCSARGSRRRSSVFLAALAIADDIGAVLVIALFYTASVSWIALAVAGGGCSLLSSPPTRAGVRAAWAYALIGIAPVGRRAHLGRARHRRRRAARPHDPVAHAHQRGGSSCAARASALRRLRRRAAGRGAHGADQQRDTRRRCTRSTRSREQAQAPLLAPGARPARRRRLRHHAAVRARQRRRPAARRRQPPLGAASRSGWSSGSCSASRSASRWLAWAARRVPGSRAAGRRDLAHAARRRLARRHRLHDVAVHRRPRVLATTRRCSPSRSSPSCWRRSSPA